MRRESSNSAPLVARRTTSTADRAQQETSAAVDAVGVIPVAASYARRLDSEEADVNERRKPQQRSDFGGGPGMRPTTEWQQYQKDRREQWRDDDFANKRRRKQRDRDR